MEMEYSTFMNIYLSAILKKIRLDIMKGAGLFQIQTIIDVYSIKVTDAF